MDRTSGHVPASFTPKVSKHPIEVVDAGGHSLMVAPFQLDAYDVSQSLLSNSTKASARKWKVIDGSTNLHDISLLNPGLGCTSSSCISISSRKEIEENSSINLGLNFNIDLTADNKCEKTDYCGTPMVLTSEKPELDLELSLSTCFSGSAITNITQGSEQFVHSALEIVTRTRAQLTDEGSTSSRWKLGPRVPPLQSTETITDLGLVPGHNNPIPIIPGSSSTTTATPKSSFACASGATPQKQRWNSRVKPCQFSGCTKGARGATGFCIGHGGGRRCQKPGCKKGAEGKTVFCKAHGGGRRCQHLGCTKSAEGCTDKCIRHGGGRRCNHSGCPRAARGKSGLCIKHGGGKRCKMENCNKSAEGIASLCIAHGGGRRCQYTNCNKGAQGSTMFCKAHGGGKRCTSLGCMKGAEGSTSFCKGHGGGKRCTFVGGCTKSVHGGTSFCVNHGGGKRCAMDECTKSARGKTNFCVCHGGGKRCKFGGCDKSAQGRTDFCKGHGGGKRCAWGQSELGGQAVAPCNKFSRGKSGFCVSHGSRVDATQLHGGSNSTLYSAPLDFQVCSSGKMKGIYAYGDNHDITVGSGRTSFNPMGYWNKGSLMQFSLPDTCMVENSHSPQISLPEGRVHGGSLMAMLRSSASGGTSKDYKEVGASLEPGTSQSMPHNWV